MKNSLKRTIAGAVLGTTLAVGGAALAAVPANAANLWEPGTVSVTPQTPGTAGALNFTMVYNGAATTASGVDLTLNAPAGVQFQAGTTGGYNGTGGNIRITQQYTAQPSYIKCTWISASQVKCSGPVLDGAGNTASYQVPLNPGDTILVRTTALVPVGYNGPVEAVTAGGTVTTAAGVQTIPTTGVAQIVGTQIVDIPVIAPAIAGIALLGAAGIGGGVLARRKKAKAAAANA
ncbi:hypothetical protein ACRAWB_14475 [Leifsonia poae]|uniref:hypothetical protein n=1 Tax=Leifsonia poae TaxID=110933 RepID=UPI003D69389E